MHLNRTEQGKMRVFANSIDEAKRRPTTNFELQDGDIVWVLNAVNPNELSAYQFRLGNVSESLPQVFEPNDNLGICYYQLVQ